MGNQLIHKEDDGILPKSELKTIYKNYSSYMDLVMGRYKIHQPYRYVVKGQIKNINKCGKINNYKIYECTIRDPVYNKERTCLLVDKFKQTKHSIKLIQESVGMSVYFIYYDPKTMKTFLNKTIGSRLKFIYIV